MSRLLELGRQVAALQDSDLEALGGTEKAGEAFIRAVRRQALPKRRRSAPYLLVAAMVGAIAVLFVGPASMHVFLAPRPLVVEPAISLGDTIHAAEPIPLRFSDGSQVDLAAGTEAVIRELTSDGAWVDLERGTARVAVSHRPRTSWSLHAGPYAVQVTGTRFDLAWSPDERRFSLDLWEGSVRVSSEGSEHSAVEMVAPERLVIDAKGWHLSRAGESVAAPEPSPASTRVAPAATEEPHADASAEAAPLKAPVESWDALAGRGDYQAAYEAAKAQGLGALARRGSASQLIALAETCRLSGHGSEGVAVLSRLRARFPGTEEAALAAFQLGRLTGGAQWFRTYLEERPDGRLAREAAGRLMESLEQSGSRDAARAAAREYLVKHPAGPHAAIAVRILDD